MYEGLMAGDELFQRVSMLLDDEKLGDSREDGSVRCVQVQQDRRA